jgi:hypothetical protein
VVVEITRPPGKKEALVERGPFHSARLVLLAQRKAVKSRKPGNAGKLYPAAARGAEPCGFTRKEPRTVSPSAALQAWTSVPTQQNCRQPALVHRQP